LEVRNGGGVRKRRAANAKENFAATIQRIAKVSLFLKINLTQAKGKRWENTSMKQTS
jgi:hypothetical protein